MALNVRHPVWLSAEQPGANAFAALFLLESFARASLSAVIPLQVYFIFQNKETVSLVYTALAAVTFGLNFLIPFAIHVLSRRWAYTLGAVMIATASAPGRASSIVITAPLIRIRSAGITNS